MPKKKPTQAQALEEALALLRWIHENRSQCYVPNTGLMFHWDERLRKLMERHPL